jgi:hypothetical protein
MKSNFKIILLITILMLTTNCSNDPVQVNNNNNNTQIPSDVGDSSNIGVSPSVATSEIQKVTNKSALIFGKITNTGNSSILSKGVVWSTTPNPTISDNKKEELASSNIFSVQLTNLDRNTTYYVRAFATNTSGTSYGQELVFTSLNNYKIFSTDSEIYSQVLKNTKDKIVYMIIYDFNFNTGIGSNFNLIAYDYINKTIIQQKAISPFIVSSPTVTHAIGSYNNQMELYILSYNAISILNPVTLQVINTLNFPDHMSISSVEQKNGLLFISYTDSNTFDSRIAVYNRSTLNLISDIISYSNAATLAVYTDLTNPNLIKCLGFPQLSNNMYFDVLDFDNNGNYLAFSSGKYNGEGPVLRTRDNVNFIIKGKRGRIYFKNNFINNTTTLSSDDYLTDYEISSDGNYIYSIQSDPNYNYKIVKHNTTNFTIDSFITIREKSAKNLFIDNNNYYVVDYDYFEPIKEVFLSVY